MAGRLRSLGKDAFVYGLLTAVARLLGFLLTPYQTHYLTSAQYGVQGVIYSCMGFASIIFLYGMDSAYMRFAAEDKADARETFSTAFWAVAFISLALCGAMLLFAPRLALHAGFGAEGVFSLRLAAMVLLADALAAVPLARMRLERRAGSFVGVRLAGVCTTVICNILFLGLLNMGLAGVFIAALAGSVVSLALCLPYAAGLLAPLFTPRVFRALWRFGLPLVPAALASAVVNLVDRPLLLRFSGAEAAGVYQACYRMGGVMMLLVTIFDQAWRPFAMENAGGPEAPALLSRVFSWFAFFATAAALAIAMFMGDFIRFSHLVAQPYWVALGIIPIIAAAYLLYGFYINFLTGPLLAKDTGPVTLAALCGAAVNIGLNLFLIPRWSFTGAAWATFAAYLVMAAVMYASARRVYPVKYELARTGVLLSSAFAAWLPGGMMAPLFGCTDGTALLLKLACFAAWPACLYFAGFFRSGEISAMRGILAEKIRI